MGHRKKRTLRRTILFPAVALLFILTAPGCKWGVPEYTLTVTLEEGVTGIPEAGTYTYEELSRVDYVYRGIDPQMTVEVLLNGRLREPGSGTIVMYGDNYELKVSLVDIRGEWDVVMTYNDGETDNLEFTIQIEGADILSGTFTDSLGRNGTWTALYDFLTLAYWDWEFYVLTNTVFDFGTESGMFSGGGKSGSWTATKVE